MPIRRSTDPFDYSMWLIYFVRAFQGSLDANLSPYVTSDFDSHSLLPVISIISAAMSAAVFMPLTKVLNIWDRSIGFIIMAMFATLGLILSASCNDVETYAASQVCKAVWK